MCALVGQNVSNLDSFATTEAEIYAQLYTVLRYFCLRFTLNGTPTQPAPPAMHARGGHPRTGSLAGPAPWLGLSIYAHA